MTILIAPIGKKPDHVKSWLIEYSRDAEVLWLIHSKKSPDFDYPKIAKDLIKDIKKTNNRLKIKLKVIDDAFSLEPTYDAIMEIIIEEEKRNEQIVRKEFLLNITGGTNVMAAATITAASWFSTMAHYVLEPRPGDEKKKYVIDLPIRPIGYSKMKESHKKVLDIIANHQYTIENTPIGVDSTPILGRISNSLLLEKMGWAKKRDDPQHNKNKANTLNAITSKLSTSGYIKVFNYVEYYVLPNGKKLESNTKLDKSENPPVIQYEDSSTHGRNNFHPYETDGVPKQTKQKAEWPLSIEKNHRETMFEITNLGKFASKNSMME